MLTVFERVFQISKSIYVPPTNHFQKTMLHMVWFIIVLTPLLMTNAGLSLLPWCCEKKKSSNKCNLKGKGLFCLIVQKYTPLCQEIKEAGDWIYNQEAQGDESFSLAHSLLIYSSGRQHREWRCPQWEDLPTPVNPTKLIFHSHD